MPIPEPPQSTLPPRPAIVRPALVVAIARRTVQPRTAAVPRLRAVPLVVPARTAPIRYAAPVNC